MKITNRLAAWFIAGAIMQVANVCAAPVLRGSYAGHLYYLLDENGFWDAEAQAIALGGHLATVDDAAENVWLTANFPEYLTVNLWIGLNDETTEGSYVWTSGEPVTFTNWAVGEPGNGNGPEDPLDEDGVHLWNDINGNGSTLNDIYVQPSRFYSTRWLGIAEVPASQIPEPSTLLLIGTGLLGVVGRFSRSKSLASVCPRNIPPKPEYISSSQPGGPAWIEFSIERRDREFEMLTTPRS